jgi:hypothetical protein
MNYLLLGWSFQLLFALMIIGVGHAVSQYISKYMKWPELVWLERIAFGALIVIIVLFIGGVLITQLPYALRRIASFIFIALLLLNSLVALWLGGWRDLRTASIQQHIVATSTLGIAMMALSMAWLPVQLPNELIDGPYVVKKDLPAVRVQHISGTLPIDNAIPHVATEYLLRDISFAKERPLMPGQEVSNRPIMVSFLLVPWHAIVSMPPKQHESMPRFEYVGQSWPDFSVLLQDSNAWAVSVALGAALNSLLILIAGVWLVRQPFVGKRELILFALLAVSSPYVLVQTFFTWPKALAGFFIILGYFSIVRGLPVAIAGVAMGLAYWSHPYAIVYFIFFAVWLSLRGSNLDGQGLKLSMNYFVKFALIFALVVAPWFIWTRLILHIPSDLVSQNLSQGGQRWQDFLWIRIVNFYTTLAPTFLQIYPFNSNVIFRSMSVNFAGGLGLIPFLVLVHKIAKNGYSNFIDLALPLLLPGVALIAIFSNLAVPALHGLQPLILLGIASAIAHLPNLKFNRYHYCPNVNRTNSIG